MYSQYLTYQSQTLPRPKPSFYSFSANPLDISLEQSDEPSVTVNSTGYPDPPLIPNGNQENRWSVNCNKSEPEELYAKSEGIPFNLTYDCFAAISCPTSVLSKPRIQNRSEYKFSKL